MIHLMYMSLGKCQQCEVGAHPFTISGVLNASSVLISEGLLVCNVSGRCLNRPRVRLKPAESGCQVHKIEWPAATPPVTESCSNTAPVLRAATTLPHYWELQQHCTLLRAAAGGCADHQMLGWHIDPHGDLGLSLLLFICLLALRQGFSV